jgi:hypothetical protein
MSDTPRTDEMREAYVNFQHGKYTVDVGDVFDFARKLERELNEVTKQRDTLAEALEALERTAGLPALQNDPARVQARKVLASVEGGSHE